MADILETLLVLFRGDSSQLRREFGAIQRESTETKAKVTRDLDFRSIGASLSGLAGGGGVLFAMRAMAQESAQTAAAVRTYENAVDRAGASQDAAGTMVTRLASKFGVLESDVQSAAGQLLKAGLDIDTIESTLTSLGASGALVGSDIAQSMQQGAEGIAYQRSELLEFAGVASNASDGYKEMAASLGVTVEQLTAQQKATAYARQIIRETAPDVEDFADTFGDYARSQADASREASEFRNRVGALAQQGLVPVNNSLAAAVGWFNDLPEPVQRTAVAVAAAAGGATALAGGIGALSLVLSPLLGPAGLLILAASAIVGIVTAVESVETTSAQSELEKLGTAAETSAGKIGAAGDKAALRGALIELGEVAGGEAKDRIQDLIDKLDDAGIKFDEVKGKAQEMVAELALAPLQAQKAAIQAKLAPTEQARGEQSVEGLVSDYETRLTRELGFEVDIRIEKQEDGSFRAVTDSLEGLRGSAEQAEIVMDALATITASANDRSANLTDQQRALRGQLAAVNTEIEAQQAALAKLTSGTGNGAGNSNSNGGRSDEEGFVVLSPDAEATLTELSNLEIPPVEVTVSGEPIDIFGVVFDPTTGTTQQGAAPTVTVKAAVELEIPDVTAQVTEAIELALPNVTVDVKAGRQILGKGYEPGDTRPTDYGPGAYATVTPSVPLMTSPNYVGDKPTVEVNADPFADAGQQFLDGLTGVFNSAANQLGQAIGSGDFSEMSGGDILGSIFGIGASAATAAGGPLGIVAGLGLSLIGGIFSGIGDGGESDSRSRAEKDFERRAGAAEVNINASVYQTNNYNGAPSDPQNDIAFNRQVRQIVQAMFDQLDLGNRLDRALPARNNY